MMQFRTVIKALSLLAGAGIFLLGVVWLVMAASGAVESGGDVAYVAGAGLLLVAAPLLAVPFSTRLAKSSAVLILAIFALGMLWLAFQPGDPNDRPVVAQVGAIAFAVLLFSRVGLALRRKDPRLDT